MASAFGDNRNMVCPSCGLRYDLMRTGLTFERVRNDIIAIGWCTKKNKIKHGRRRGVLGYWHELKMMLWDQHLGDCEREARKKSA